MASKEDFTLAKNIGFMHSPLLMQDYMSLVSVSDDPEVKRRALELLHKMQDKESGADGAIFNFSIDMSGMITGTIEAPKGEVIEADDQRPATPLLEDPNAADHGVIDLADLLAIDQPAPDPVAQ